MKSILGKTAWQPWTPGSPLYGADSVHDGHELVHLKVLSDRRADGQGIAFIVKFSPPEGKLIKLVAVARSEEHVYILEGGYCNHAGEQIRFPNDYGMNPTGKPHSAFIGQETTALAVYSGEPDEVRQFE
ncbi:MAG: hypothetical protein ACREQ4_07805, partial [Candidatus Binataceae bacterium]